MLKTVTDMSTYQLMGEAWLLLLLTYALGVVLGALTCLPPLSPSWRTSVSAVSMALTGTSFKHLFPEEDTSIRPP